MTDFRTIAPQVREFPQLTLPQPTTVTLPNGGLLHSLNNGDQPVAMMSLIYDGGSCEMNRRGALQLMAATISEGTANHSAEEIAEILDFNGAWFRVDTSSHNVTVTLQALVGGLNEILPIVADIITNPTFPIDKVESIKRKLIAGARLNLKKVGAIANHADRKAIFGDNHPMYTNIVMPDDLESLTRDDVVEAWRCTLGALIPQIYLAGQISDVQQLVVELFGQQKPAYSNGLTRQIIPAQPMAEHRSTVNVDGAMQSAVVLSIPTIPRSHPDYIDLRMAGIALGGYFGSRLMTNIREEKGLTYGINASLCGYAEGGVLNISSQTDPRYVEQLIDETIKEIVDLQTSPMSNEEFEIVKRYEMSSLAATLDSPFNIISLVMTRQTVGTPDDYFEQQQRALREATPERIAEVMSRHIDTNNIYVTIAGPAI